MSKRKNVDNIIQEPEIETPEKAIETPEPVINVSEEAIKTPEAGNLMYVGPSIIGVIRHSSVFKDGILPKAVEECIEEYPPMKKLFIPLDGLAEATLMLRKKSALSAVFAKTAQKFTRRK